MGTTYKQTADAVVARYNKLWEQADAEYDRFGKITEATKDAIMSAELDMALLGI